MESSQLFNTEVKRYESWLTDSNTQMLKKKSIQLTQIVDVLFGTEYSCRVACRLSPLHERTDLSTEQQKAIILASQSNDIRCRSRLDEQLCEKIYDAARALYFAYASVTCNR